jgi:hypothetical protein
MRAWWRGVNKYGAKWSGDKPVRNKEGGDKNNWKRGSSPAQQQLREQVAILQVHHQGNALFQRLLQTSKTRQPAHGGKERGEDNWGGGGEGGGGEQFSNGKNPAPAHSLHCGGRPIPTLQPRSNPYEILPPFTPHTPAKIAPGPPPRRWPPCPPGSSPAATRLPWTC